MYIITSLQLSCGSFNHQIIISTRWGMKTVASHARCFWIWRCSLRTSRWVFMNTLGCHEYLSLSWAWLKLPVLGSWRVDHLLSSHGSKQIQLTSTRFNKQPCRKGGCTKDCEDLPSNENGPMGRNRSYIYYIYIRIYIYTYIYIHILYDLPWTFWSSKLFFGRMFGSNNKHTSKMRGESLDKNTSFGGETNLTQAAFLDSSFRVGRGMAYDSNGDSATPCWQCRIQHRGATSRTAVWHAYSTGL